MSQITSLAIVYSTVYSGADQRKPQSSASLAFVRGIHRGPVNSLHKWPVTRKMFPFDDVIMNTLFKGIDSQRNMDFCWVCSVRDQGICRHNDNQVRSCIQSGVDVIGSNMILERIKTTSMDKGVQGYSTKIKHYWVAKIKQINNKVLAYKDILRYM